LTAADPCIWHDSGTNLSRRQSATTAAALTDDARVCFAVPRRPQPRYRLVSSTPASSGGGSVTTMREPTAWEAGRSGARWAATFLYFKRAL
jgi:hypothetical protein